ncbi:MAG: N-acetyltransferase [Vulcanimicrobiota bacterium]
MSNFLTLRSEEPRDHDAISSILEAAFSKGKEYRGETEVAIVHGLREAGDLSVALVAEEDNQLVGYIAFSPVSVGSVPSNWFGLGPLCVRPDRQGRGIGRALVEEGLRLIRSVDSEGCVVLGEPEYYGRFGFHCDARLTLPEVPPRYFQVLAFGRDVPLGPVAYAAAFRDN